MCIAFMRLGEELTLFGRGGEQECPTSGVLWAEEVGMAPRPKKKQRSIDAIKRCDNEPHVIVAVAQLFWNDRKVCPLLRAATPFSSPYSGYPVCCLPV